MTQMDDDKKRSISLTGKLNVLYSNVRIRRVEADSALNALMIVAACADREDQKILYEGVLYSQIDQSAQGERVAIAVEITPEEFRGAQYHACAARMMKDCGLANLDSAEVMAGHGYRFLAHFIVHQDERVVIAKRVLVE